MIWRCNVFALLPWEGGGCTDRSWMRAQSKNYEPHTMQDRAHDAIFHVHHALECVSHLTQRSITWVQRLQKRMYNWIYWIVIFGHSHWILGIVGYQKVSSNPLNFDGSCCFSTAFEAATCAQYLWIPPWIKMHSETGTLWDWVAFLYRGTHTEWIPVTRWS